MLQRYDISMDTEANRLSIKEFAVLGRISRKREHSEPAHEKYSLIHEVTFDGNIIRVAINGERKEALISELRSDNFYPSRCCAEIIAERVSGLFEDNAETFSEVFFDDRAFLSKDDA